MSRRHPPPATGIVPNDDADDLTWLQYLQTEGNTVPPPQQPPLRSSSTSSDRKRRNDSIEHHGRSHPYPNPTSASSHFPTPPTAAPRTNDPRLRHTSISMAGSNPETAIDLTSPPRQPPPHPHRGSSASTSIRDPRQRRRSSRESEILLPKWQPDASAIACPVCGIDFGFWNRRHHCRKCGRVVCATCSPHRITIPRQYVVQPPVNTYSHSDDGVDGMESGRGVFGGGEVVRVCNPCVPDPWTPENANVRGGGGGGEGTGTEGVRARPLIEGASNASSSGGVPVLTAMDVMRAGYNRNVPPPSAPAFTNQEGGVRHRSLSHQPATAGTAPQQTLPPALPTVSRGERYRQAVAAVSATTTTDPRSRLAPAEHSRPISHRYSLSHNSPQSTRTAHTHTSTSGNAASLPPVPAFAPTRPAITTTPSAPPPSQPARPRREVREEDECPVCGMELPPGEQVRERHVEECIAARFSSTPSSSSMPRRQSGLPGREAAVPLAYPSPATETAPSYSHSHGSGSIPSGSLPPTTATQARARAQSFRPRGMALYTATEKDCLDSSGEAVECVICLEEFQPGEEMGRMECLCKFHRGCIRGWWEAKVAKGGERGGCPTHVHYD
ncbi:hypothetical protein LTR17_026195 [Elasticomyces elasticus]|nr:hypothetical protein LTR17_026195 [Elasticomyces elasticus]